MKTLKIESWSEIPKNYTGAIKYRDGSKHWFIDRKHHRTDGPAVEYPSGTMATMEKHGFVKECCIELVGLL